MNREEKEYLTIYKVKDVWTDMRPLSLRKKMEEVAQKA